MFKDVKENVATWNQKMLQNSNKDVYCGTVDSVTEWGSPYQSAWNSDLAPILLQLPTNAAGSHKVNRWWLHHVSCCHPLGKVDGALGFCFQQGPALAVADMWGAKSADGRSLILTKINKQKCLKQPNGSS